MLYVKNRTGRGWDVTEETELGLLILERISSAKEAPLEELRSPSRYSIVAELCSEFCSRLKREGKKSGEIVEESTKYMKKLEKEFARLLEENPRLFDKAANKKKEETPA